MWVSRTTVTLLSKLGDHDSATMLFLFPYRDAFFMRNGKFDGPNKLEYAPVA